MKHLLAKLGLISAARVAQRAPKTPPPPEYQPYGEASLNFLYNLLFCDDLALFARNTKAAAEEPWKTLLAGAPDERALRRIADDAGMESRLRALAFLRLRDIGAAVVPKILFGVIVEIPMQRGLDTLAAYADGRVRYLNQIGHAAIFEGGPPQVAALATKVNVEAQPLVRRIGPWEGARRPPPAGDAMRLSLLVSDGLYFGEGRFEQLSRDPQGGPVLDAAAELLKAVVAAATKK